MARPSDDRTSAWLALPLALSGLVVSPLFMLGLGIDEVMLWPAVTLLASFIAYLATGGHLKYGTATERRTRRRQVAVLSLATGVVGSLLYDLLDSGAVAIVTLLTACILGGVLSITFQTRYLPSRYERDRAALG